MSVVLVTGAARRLGRDVSLALARAGWDVAVHCHHSAAQGAELASELQALGVRAAVFKADLSDEHACRELLPQVADALGSVHAVVNNASQFVYDDAASFSYEMLLAHIKTNTAPAIVLAQALYEMRVKEGSLSAASSQGVVVNLLDQKLWNLNPDYLSYTLSKAALRAATEMLAQALAPVVRVVGVAPGLTLPSTEMTDEEFAKLHQLSPLQQSSTAQDVVQAVCFAISNRALTGTTLLVDGGQHLMPQPRDFSRMT